MKHVLTEYYSLKKELEHTQSRIEEQDRLLLNFDRREAAMIAKISKDERKPREGFTYMQLQTRKPKINLFQYSSIIDSFCGEKLPGLL